MHKIIAISFLIIALASCKTTKLPTTEKSVIKDSIIEKEKIIYRDSLVQLPGDTITLNLTIPCPDAVVNEYAGNERMSLTAKSNGKGKIKVNCKTDSLSIVIDSLKTIIREKEQYHSSTQVILQPYPVTVIKYKVPQLVKWLLLIACIQFLWHSRHIIISIIKKIIGL